MLRAVFFFVRGSLSKWMPKQQSTSVLLIASK